MGDPAGIGPEIVMQALEDQEVLAASRPLVVGDLGVLEQAKAFCRLHGKIRVVAEPADANYISGTVDLIDLGNVEVDSLEMGVVSGMGGQAAFEYIEKAVELASSKKVDAIATGPINKESLKAAKVDFIGHTEILAALTGVDEPLTMFQVHSMMLRMRGNAASVSFTGFTDQRPSRVHDNHLLLGGCLAFDQKGSPVGYIPYKVVWSGAWVVRGCPWTSLINRSSCC